MNEDFDTKRLILLRKVTRTVAELLRGQLKEYLSTLTPVIRPKALLGDFVTGGTKESPAFADKAFQEVIQIYQHAGGSKPFAAPKEVKAPLDLVFSPLELNPLEYIHVAKSGTDAKTVTITSPLKWVMSTPGLAPSRLKEILADRSQAAAENAQRAVLHYSVLHFVLRRQTGFQKVLEALRFTLTQTTLPDFGNLPVPVLSTPISTTRPPDDVIIENTEVSGMNVVEEVINLDDIGNLRDPFRDQIENVVREFGAV
jgi:hypothetical protein